MDQFTQGYLEAALWYSTDDCDDALDKNYSTTDFAPECLQGMVADCEKFQAANAYDICSYNGRPSVTADRAAGRNFWQTRNRHGSGFWDSPEDWPSGAHKRLTDDAHEYRELSVYIGDDRLIYVS